MQFLFNFSWRGVATEVEDHQQKDHHLWVRATCNFCSNVILVEAAEQLTGGGVHRQWRCERCLDIMVDNECECHTSAKRNSSAGVWPEMECVVQQSTYWIKYSRWPISWADPGTSWPSCPSTTSGPNALVGAGAGVCYKGRRWPASRRPCWKRSAIARSAGWRLKKQSEGKWSNRQKLQWVHTNGRAIWIKVE